MAKITPGEFDTWAGRHATIFGMLKPEERQMINFWRPIFAGCGYTLAELRYATEMIARGPPKYRGEHLDRIHVVIGGLRKKSADEEMSALSAIEEFEACKNCRSAGWVFVPHPNFIVSGEWSTYLGTAYKPVAVVTCSCDRGVRISSTHQHKRPLGLEQYEQRNPDWKQQLVEQEAASAAIRKVVRHTIALDNQFGKLVGNIASHMDAKPQACAISPAELARLKRLEAGEVEPGRPPEEIEEFEIAARRSRQMSPHQLRLFEEGETK